MKYFIVCLTIVLSMVSNVFGQSIFDGKELTRTPLRWTSFVVPDGFEAKGDRGLFVHNHIPANIKCEVFGKSFSDVIFEKTFPENLSKKNIKLLSNEVFESTDGIIKVRLLSFEQLEYGVERKMWTIVLGNEGVSLAVSAEYPKEYDYYFYDMLRKTLLTTTWSKFKWPGTLVKPNYEIKGVAEQGTEEAMQFAEQKGNTLIYTYNGVYPLERNYDPVFFVRSSFEVIQGHDLQQEAKWIVEEIYNIEDLEILEIKPITIMNRGGYQIVAKGWDNETYETLKILATVLFEDTTYHLIAGIVNESNFEYYEKEFIELTESFEIKKPRFIESDYDFDEDLERYTNSELERQQKVDEDMKVYKSWHWKEKDKWKAKRDRDKAMREQEMVEINKEVNELLGIEEEIEEVEVEEEEDDGLTEEDREANRILEELNEEVEMEDTELESWADENNFVIYNIPEETEE